MCIYACIIRRILYSLSSHHYLSTVHRVTFAATNHGIEDSSQVSVCFERGDKRSSSPDTAVTVHTDGHREVAVGASLSLVVTMYKEESGKYQVHPGLHACAQCCRVALTSCSCSLRLASWWCWSDSVAIYVTGTGGWVKRLWDWTVCTLPLHHTTAHHSHGIHRMLSSRNYEVYRLCRAHTALDTRDRYHIALP